MYKFKLLFLTAVCLGIGSAAHAADNQDRQQVYQQIYATYLLYHPQAKQQSSQALTENFTTDYATLFQSSKNINRQQFIDFEQTRLQSLLKERRDMSLKQTYVRYGILDKDKDQKLTLKEFQEVGLKSFDEWDKNKDGVVNAADAALASQTTGTHDGFRVRLPIAMPMPSNTEEFIQQYGQGKSFVTLANYLTGRDQQFIATDRNQDLVLSQQEYVDEFMQRYDQNLSVGQEKMKELSAQQFELISKGKDSFKQNDLKKFVKQLDQMISQ